MTTVGLENIFSIEWNHYAVDENTGALYGNISYIANNQRIEGGGTAINWAINGLKKYFFPYYEDHCNVPIDFSNINKDDVFYSIFYSMYGPSYTICPNQYREFYTLCKQLMIEEYYANKTCYSEEMIQESILRGDDYSEDYLLGGWIHGTFGVEDLAGDALLDYRIYLVRDIAKYRERLIWTCFDKCDKEGNIVQRFPVYEAIMPIGYFKNVQTEFVEVATKEIEQASERNK